MLRKASAVLTELLNLLVAYIFGTVEKCIISMVTFTINRIEFFVSTADYCTAEIFASPGTDAGTSALLES